MRTGEFVQAGRRFVRIEDIKQDGSKIKINGHWVPAGGVKVLHPAVQQVLEDRERRKEEKFWDETRRLVCKILRLLGDPSWREWA